MTFQLDLLPFQSDYCRAVDKIVVSYSSCVRYFFISSSRQYSLLDHLSFLLFFPLFYRKQSDREEVLVKQVSLDARMELNKPER